MGATIEAVGRHGYLETTLREIVALAGVSNTTFYEHFETVEDCFLATFDQIVASASEQVGRAYRSKADFDERLRAAFESYVDFVIADPAAASLVLVDALALGTAGVARRQQAAAAFDLMFRQSFDQAAERGEVSDLTIRAINGGIRAVAYRCLRRGELDRLGGYMEELLEWGLLYQRPGGVASLPGIPAKARARPAERSTLEGAGDGPEWSEPPGSPRSRAILTQRERLLRATAIVAAEKGYASLTIPAITALAGVSNQTFYAQFSNKQEAFLGALDGLSQHALTRVAGAIGVAKDWVGCGV
jgi:AcrR family transcriptional regulator